MRYDVSPNDKGRPSMLLRVAGLTSSRGPYVCQGTWLSDSPTLCTDGTNILLLITMPVHTNQLHTMPTVIFSWNLYMQSWDTHRDSVELPGIQILVSREKFQKLTSLMMTCQLQVEKVVFSLLLHQLLVLAQTSAAAYACLLSLMESLGTKPPLVCMCVCVCVCPCLSVCVVMCESACV